MAWQVIAMVALANTLIRRRSATIAYAFWMIVLVRLLLPPDLALPNGWGWWLRTPLAEQSVAMERQDSMIEAQDKTAPGTSERDSIRRANLPWNLLLMLAWSGIVAARLGMLITAMLQVRVWIARATPIQDASILKLLNESARSVRLHRQIDLKNSEACSTPLVVGWCRPVILLPSQVLTQLTPAELRAVLVHELCHVKRGDSLVNTLQTVLGLSTSSIRLFGTPIRGSATFVRMLVTRRRCVPCRASGSRMARQL